MHEVTNNLPNPFRDPFRVEIYERELRVIAVKKPPSPSIERATALPNAEKKPAHYTPDMFQLGNLRHREWLSGYTPIVFDQEQVAPRRKAGDITYFSRKSRMRLFRKFNRMNTRGLSAPVFITLTTRHGECSPADFQYRFRKSFLPALKRIVPGLVYIWRLEPHRSGYPHYHMLVWSKNRELNLESEYWKRRIRRSWRDAIGQHDRAAELYSCKVVALKSMRQITRYLSKYMAKEDDDRGRKIKGRRWAVSDSFSCCPITAFSLTQSEEERLWKIAKRLLLERGKSKLVEKLELFRGYGWSIWTDRDQVVSMFAEIGNFMPLNAWELYDPPPDQ